VSYLSEKVYISLLFFIYFVIYVQLNIHFKQTAFSTDIQAPSITCPPDMDNIPTEPGKSYANVNWQLPVLNDNSNENLILTGSRPPQKLDVGKKHITYKVTDSSGLSRSCIFFIHVKGTHCIYLKGDGRLYETYFYLSPLIKNTH